MEVILTSVPESPTIHIWVFPKIGIPQNGWLIMENPIKMDDLGVPLFWQTSISGQMTDIPRTESRGVLGGCP